MVDFADLLVPTAPRQNGGKAALPGIEGASPLSGDTFGTIFLKSARPAQDPADASDMLVAGLPAIEPAAPRQVPMAISPEALNPEMLAPEGLIIHDPAMAREAAIVFPAETLDPATVRITASTTGPQPAQPALADGGHLIMAKGAVPASDAGLILTDATVSPAPDTLALPKNSRGIAMPQAPAATATATVPAPATDVTVQVTPAAFSLKPVIQPEPAAIPGHDRDQRMLRPLLTASADTAAKAPPPLADLSAVLKEMKAVIVTPQAGAPDAGKTAIEPDLPARLQVLPAGETADPDALPEPFTVKMPTGTLAASAPASLTGQAMADAGTSAAGSIQFSAAPAPVTAPSVPASPAAVAIAAADPAVQSNAAQQIVSAIESGKGGMSRMELRLDPPELGRISIDFRFDGDQRVTAVLNADLPETGAMIRRSLDVLMRDLATAGFSDINLSMGNGEAGRDRAAQSQQPAPRAEGSTGSAHHQQGPGSGAAMTVSPAEHLYAWANDCLDIRL